MQHRIEAPVFYTGTSFSVLGTPSSANRRQAAQTVRCASIASRSAAVSSPSSRAETTSRYCAQSIVCTPRSPTTVSYWSSVAGPATDDVPRGYAPGMAEPVLVPLFGASDPLSLYDPVSALAEWRAARTQSGVAFRAATRPFGLRYAVRSVMARSQATN